MNQIRTLFILLFVGVVLMACKKEEPAPEPVPVVSEPSMVFSVSMDAKNVSVPVQSINTTTSGNDIDVHAIKDNHYFNLYLTDTLKQGTYVFEANGVGPVSFIYRDNNDLGMSFRSNGGSLTITDVDASGRVIKGTFNCTAKADFIDSTHTITDGQFKIRY